MIEGFYSCLVRHFIHTIINGVSVVCDYIVHSV